MSEQEGKGPQLHRTPSAWGGRCAFPHSASAPAEPGVWNNPQRDPQQAARRTFHIADLSTVREYLFQTDGPGRGWAAGHGSVEDWTVFQIPCDDSDPRYP